MCAVIIISQRNAVLSGLNDRVVSKVKLYSVEYENMEAKMRGFRTEKKDVDAMRASAWHIN